MSESRIFNNPLEPVLSVNAGLKTPAGKPLVKAPAVNLQDVLRQEIREVKFSQHALNRLEQRNIRLNAGQLDRLGTAVSQAARKGARKSLVLMDNQLAFVVSVRNRTVITALDGDSLKENLFTNIDSAIVI